MLCHAVFVLAASTLAGLPRGDSPGPRSHWEPLVQPATYVSPSGASRCHVRSHARDWRAGGRVRMERNGEVVFERDVTCVPWDGAALDDGRMVYVGFRADDGLWSGDLVVTALDPAGRIAWEHVEPRQAVIVGLTSKASFVLPKWGVEREPGVVVVELDPLHRGRIAEPRCLALGLEDGRELDRGLRALPRRAEPEALPPSDVVPPAAPALEALPSLPLALPARDAVDAALPESLGWIEAFGFDEAGDVRVLSTVDGAVVATRLDRAGRVLATVRLERLPFELDYRCAVSLGPHGTWLVAPPSRHRVVRLDPACGAAVTVLNHAMHIDSLLAFQDGGFALLESRGGLRCFDPQGEPITPAVTGAELASHELEYRLLGRNVTGDAIAVAYPSDDALRLTLLTDGGRSWRHVAPPRDADADLDPYGDAVWQTRAGSFWLATSGTQESTFVERDFAGAVLRRLSPRLADGAMFPFELGSLEVAPDGTLASANTDVVATLPPTGGPGVVLGRHVEPLTWEWFRGWHVGRDGRIAVVAGDRSAALFGPEGADGRDGRVGRALRAPTTCDEPYGELHMDGSGEFWWQISRVGPFACFDGAGEPLGVRRLGDDEQAIAFCGEGTTRWSTDGREVVHIDAEGRVARRLPTRPDGAWWRDVAHLAASPDGRRLAVADVLRAGGRAEGAFLALHDFETGEAWHLDGPEPGALALAGDWVTWGRILVHLPTRMQWTLLDDLRAVSTPRGPELWRVLDPTPEDEEPDLEVRRFAVPSLAR